MTSQLSDTHLYVCNGPISDGQPASTCQGEAAHSIMTPATDALLLLLACEDHLDELRRWVTARDGTAFVGGIEQVQRTVLRAAVDDRRVVWNGSQDGAPDFTTYRLAKPPPGSQPSPHWR